MYHVMSVDNNQNVVHKVVLLANVFHLKHNPIIRKLSLLCPHTWVMGGLGGPGAMKATVEAVALLATTGSLICCSTLEMFLRDLTVHTPCNIIIVIIIVVNIIILKQLSQGKKTVLYKKILGLP